MPWSRSRARELHRTGWDYRRIGRQLGIHASTVRKFVEADSFFERVAPHRGRTTDSFAPYLKQRWDSGVRNARTLYEDVKQQGFQGSYDAVCDCVAPWRSPPDESLRPARYSQRCSADQLSWLVLHRPGQNTYEQERAVAAVAALGSSWARGDLVGPTIRSSPAARSQFRSGPMDRRRDWRLASRVATVRPGPPSGPAGGR
jgi:transposase